MGKSQQMGQLEHTVALIQKRWGTRALRRAREKDASAEPAALSTGFPSVDGILGIGGLPMGRIVEMIGSNTAGQNVLVAMTLRQAQQGNQQIAYVDVDNSIDPDLMARCGVRLDALTLLRPRGFGRRFEDAIEMTNGLLREGRIGILVFDRLHPMLSKADLVALDKALRQWLAILSHSQCTLIFQTETILPDVYLPGLSLPFFASVRLAFDREEWSHHHYRVSGLRSRVTVLKNKLAPANQSTHIRMTFNGKIHVR